jgi:predicted nucleotidyltransferase
MSARHGLPGRAVAQIHRVLSQFPEVEKGVLYGSRAKGNFKRGSDIDLTLHGRFLDSRILGRVDDELDDLLLPYRFHLSIFSKISHADLIDHIRRVGVVFYNRGELAAEVRN